MHYDNDDLGCCGGEGLGKRVKAPLPGRSRFSSDPTWVHTFYGASIIFLLPPSPGCVSTSQEFPTMLQAC